MHVVQVCYHSVFAILQEHRLRSRYRITGFVPTQRFTRTARITKFRNRFKLQI